MTSVCEAYTNASDDEENQHAGIYEKHHKHKQLDTNEKQDDKQRNTRDKTIASVCFDLQNVPQYRKQKAASYTIEEADLIQLYHLWQGRDIAILCGASPQLIEDKRKLQQVLPRSSMVKVKIELKKLSSVPRTVLAKVKTKSNLQCMQQSSRHLTARSSLFFFFFYY